MTLRQYVELELVDEDFCASFNSHSITITTELIGYPFLPYDANAELSRIEIDYPVHIDTDDTERSWTRNELLVIWGEGRLQKFEKLLIEQEQEDDWERQEV